MKTFLPSMQPLTVSLLGCGWLGLPLAERLIADGYRVKGSTTTPEKLPVLAGKGIDSYLINLLPQSVGSLDSFLQADILLIDIPPKAGKQGLAHHPAQIKTIADAVIYSPVKWVVYVSSTSVYPEYSRLVSEDDVNTPAESADPAGSPAQLIVAEQLINQLSPERQTTVIRCAGLMGYDRIPGKYVAGKTVDSGRVPVNYIHRDDAVGLIAALLTAGLTGVFNVVAPQHPTRAEVYRQSCNQFGYDLPLFTEPDPALPFKIVSGQKLAGQLDYQFLYADPLTFQYGTPG